MTNSTGSQTESEAVVAKLAGGTLWQKLAFRLRFTVPLLNLGSLWRGLYFRFLGARIGSGTEIPASTLMNWPHQVHIGANCVLEDGVAFKFADSWKPGPSIVIGDRVTIARHCEFNITGRLTVGDDALIASGCRFIDHDHGIELGVPMNKQEGPPPEPIHIGEDAWLGVNVVVLKGVTVGRGAIVGAGAVLTKSVPEYEIWAGVPARKIGERK